MPVRNQVEVSYATLELNPIENPTHGMFIKWRNATKKSYQQYHDVLGCNVGTFIGSKFGCTMVFEFSDHADPLKV